MEEHTVHKLVRITTTALVGLSFLAGVVAASLPTIATTRTTFIGGALLVGGWLLIAHLVVITGRSTSRTQVEAAIKQRAVTYSVAGVFIIGVTTVVGSGLTMVELSVALGVGMIAGDFVYHFRWTPWASLPARTRDPRRA